MYTLKNALYPSSTRLAHHSNETIRKVPTDARPKRSPIKKNYASKCFIHFPMKALRLGGEAVNWVDNKSLSGKRLHFVRLGALQKQLMIE